MDQRLPFYMAYQPEMFWDEEEMCRRDIAYMKSAYPDTAKRILPYIESECDRMEYSGSMIYDEYPDQLQMRIMCRRVYDKAAKQEKEPGKWLMDLIQVMTFQEIARRRSEHRHYRRRFY